LQSCQYKISTNSVKHAKLIVTKQLSSDTCLFLPNNRLKAICTFLTMSSISAFTELVNILDPEHDSQSLSTSQNPVTSEPTNSTKSRPQRSWIWQHAVKPPLGQHKIYNNKGAAVWRCSRCRPTVGYVITGGTRIVMDHLSMIHQLPEILPPKDAK
jgi:hypothetical protein